MPALFSCGYFKVRNVIIKLYQVFKIYYSENMKRYNVLNK